MSGRLTVGAPEQWLAAEDRRSRWRVATAAVISAMLAGDDPDQLLGVVARAATELVGADVATVGVPWIPGQSLRLRVAVGYRSEDLEGAVFPVDESLSGLVLASRRSLVLDDATSNRNAYQPICELGDMGPTIITPLIARDRPFGTLLVARRRGGVLFDDGDLAALEAFADHAALAFEFGKARDELERLAVVEERERIARELHDTVIQNLFAIGLELQAVAAGCGGESAERVDAAAARLNAMIGTIRQTVLVDPTDGQATSARSHDRCH